jgi:hypothetical protein
MVANGCQIFNKTQRVVTKATKYGSLYHLYCEEASVAQQESKEMVWRSSDLQRLARDNLVKSSFQGY